MGQMTYGILLGVVDPDPEQSEALLEGWEAENKPRLEELRKTLDYFDARQCIAPDQSCPDNTPYLGFWVAIGGSGMDGVPCLDDVCLDDLQAKYGEQIALVEERWAKFAEWAKQEGTEFPSARLWLVEVEVA